MRNNLYVGGAGYTLIERIMLTTKHGRRAKDVSMSKRARLAVKRGKLDGIDLKKESDA